MNLKNQLQKKLKAVILKTWPNLEERVPVVDIEYPKDTRYGDYSTNIAMKLAPLVHEEPRQIAGKIAQFTMPAIKRIEIAGPGFVNFFLGEVWLQRQLDAILKQKARFGTSTMGRNKRINVEFISANPTGPLTLGNGRGGFTGDVLANIFELAGYKPWREYYVNDIGNQVNILAESVLRRYWQHKGIKIEYPDYCYQGAYIDELAKTLYLPNYKLSAAQKLEDIRDKVKMRILDKMLKGIQRVIRHKLNIQFDKFFSERSLYRSGSVDRVLKLLKAKGLIYKHDGAFWMKTTQFGDDKDRVVIRENGEPVYFLSDIAYHYEKLTKRKFDRIINIVGADHHGYPPRVRAAMEALGVGNRLDFILMQLVRLIRAGQEVKMSKRLGTYVTLEEVIDEVGLDAARFFFLMHAPNTHMDFDIDLAKKKSEENPVYYVQYAHARICSIIRNVEKEHKKKRKEENTSGQKVGQFERGEYGLIKELLKWPGLVEEVSQSYQVQRLPFYGMALATKFHEFYTKYRVIDRGVVNERRRQLVEATKIVLAGCLHTMGINAPEKM